MNDVVTMIHIPGNVEICLTDLLAHLRMMLETFDDSIKLYREDWQFNFDDKEKSTAVYGYDLFANSHWEKGVENLQNKEVAHLWAVFHCSINGVRISNRNVIGINAAL